MTEQQYIDYFTSLAIQSKEINHTENGMVSFAYIEQAFDLDAFDEKLRSATSSRFFLLISEEGSFSDNGSLNYTQAVDGEFLVVERTGNARTISQARNNSLLIGQNFLSRMRIDSSKRGQIVPGAAVHFRIDNVDYEKVGPLDDQWYGYLFRFRFTCPFGFTVDDATWRDIS